MQNEEKYIGTNNITLKLLIERERRHTDDD